MPSKKLIMGVIGGTLLTAAAINATAATSGAYVGGQLGYGNVHQEDGFAHTTTFPLSGHLLAGYQLNPNFAVEAGWTRFGNVNVKDTFNTLSHPVTDIITLTTNMADVAVKGSIPVADQISVYGKLGGAYVMESASLYQKGSKPYIEGKESKLMPEAGVGVSYAFTDQVSADVFYTRVQKISDKSFVNSIDFAGVGLTYNFG